MLFFSTDISVLFFSTDISDHVKTAANHIALSNIKSARQKAANVCTQYMRTPSIIGKFCLKILNGSQSISKATSNLHFAAPFTASTNTAIIT